MNEGLKPEQQELIKLNPKEIWLIDDNTDLTRSLLMSWRAKLKEKELTCQVFNTGRSAFQELQKRIEEKTDLPAVLIVDEELKLDEEDDEFRSGVNLIRAIRTIEDIPQPAIIAYSSCERSNNALIGAGANSAFIKPDRRIIDYFESLGEQSQ